MKQRMISLIPYSLVLVGVFYLLPLFIENTGLAMLFMLMIIPFVCFGCAFIYGIKQGIGFFLFPIISAVLFLPSVFIFYNSSALIYVLIYGVIALLGNLFGCIFHKKR